MPAPYYFPGSQPNMFVGPTPNPLNSNQTVNGSFGIAAIVDRQRQHRACPISSTRSRFGLGTSPITLDDPFNPRHGWKASFSERSRSPAFGSSFNYTETTLECRALSSRCCKTRPSRLHGLYEFSTGVIPPSSLFTFSDQQMRGYNYGLLRDQRVPRANRAAATADRGSQTLGRGLRRRTRLPRSAARIRCSIRTPNRIIGVSGQLGVARRLTASACASTFRNLGLRTIRIDFAKGANGTHTSFGIGQSF